MDVWVTVALVGVGGFGVGVGLVVGAYAVRWLRRFLRDDGKESGEKF